MRVRTLTALVFVAVMLAAVLVSAHAFTVFFLLLSAWCAGEFYQIVSPRISLSGRILGIAIALAVFATVAAYQYGLIFSLAYLIWLLPLLPLVFIAELFGKAAKPFSSIGFTFLGLVYVVLPFILFFSLAFVEGRYNYRIPLGFLLILWANDTGAYLAGRAFGRHKLFERISPNKTWEGLAGGVVLALVLAAIVHHYFPVFTLSQWLAIAAIISVFGTLGDLVESMLKRSLQVKDSGNILPGHGGLLDRFDGLLLAAPMVYFLVVLFV